MNSTKQCMKLLSIRKKRIPIMITSVSAYVNVSYFYVSDVSKRKYLFLFSFPAKTGVCLMIDYISFPSSGNLFSKKRIWGFHHYQPIKKRQ